MTEDRQVYEDPVADQYEKWVYPQPIEDLVEWSKTYRNAGDPAVMHYAFWPNREYKEGMNILVAGCGTNEAAALAFSNPKAKVVGIDLSASSLKHQHYLKDRHNLSNLTLHQMSIEESESFDPEFDLIIASGVLHHLKNPSEGLKILGGLLEPDGVFEMMVYAKYGRTGVYMMQEVFRHLELKQTGQDVEMVKAALNSLPADHFARFYMKAAPDLNMDSGFVDTFLHRRDQAYSVKDCLNLLDESNLDFQSWVDNGLYYPDGQIPADNPFYKRVMSLPSSKIWEIMELFCGRIFKHVFYACRKDRPKESYRLDFNGDAFWDYIPVRWISKLTQADPAKDQKPTIQRPPMRPMPLDNAQAALFNQINSQNTVKQVMDKAGISADAQTKEIYTRNFIKSMWRLGFLMVKI